MGFLRTLSVSPYESRQRHQKKPLLPFPHRPSPRLSTVTHSFNCMLDPCHAAQVLLHFRMRMRSVFIPYVLPVDRPGIGQSDDEDERERREAESDAHTVVCIEIKNLVESGRHVGFSVDSVEMQIGGEGTKAVLVGQNLWGRKDIYSEYFPYCSSPLKDFITLQWLLHQDNPSPQQTPKSDVLSTA